MTLFCMRRHVCIGAEVSYIMHRPPLPLSCRSVVTTAVQPPPAPPATPPIPPAPLRSLTRRTQGRHVSEEDGGAVVTTWPTRNEQRDINHGTRRDRASSVTARSSLHDTWQGRQDRGEPASHAAPPAPRPPSAPQWPSAPAKADNACVAPANRTHRSQLHPSLATMVDDVVCAARHTFPLQPSAALLAEQRRRLELHLWPDTIALDATTDTIDLASAEEEARHEGDVCGGVNHASVAHVSAGEEGDVVDVRGRRDGLRPLPAELETSFARHKIPSTLGGDDDGEAGADVRSTTALVAGAQEAEGVVASKSSRSAQSSQPPSPSHSKPQGAEVLKSSPCAAIGTVRAEPASTYSPGTAHSAALSSSTNAASNKRYSSEASSERCIVVEDGSMRLAKRKSASLAYPVALWRTVRDALGGMLSRRWRSS